MAQKELSSFHSMTFLGNIPAMPGIGNSFEKSPTDDKNTGLSVIVLENSIPVIADLRPKKWSVMINATESKKFECISTYCQNISGDSNVMRGRPMFICIQAVRVNSQSSSTATT